MKLLQQGNKDDASQRIAVVGTFDGVHRGHRFLLDFMKTEALCRKLEPTVITFENHPLSIIHPQDVPPQLTTIDERMELLSSCGVETCILLEFDENLRQLSARQFLEMISRDYGVKVLVVGFNTRFGRDCVDGFEQYEEKGKEVGVAIVKAPEFGSGISSSAIRKLILNKDIVSANAALGYSFSIEGVVTEGKQLGRTIGFPTANIVIADDKKLIPPFGVYIVEVYMSHLGKTYRGMLNIGRRPTVDVTNAPMSIEVHILDYEGDLYGKTLRVEFVRFLRDECRFASIDDLVEQLSSDREQAKM